MAVKDAALADAIARAVAAFDPALILSRCPGPSLPAPATAAGLRVALEGFADRAYEPDGSLTPRSRAGSRHPRRAMLSLRVRCGWRRRHSRPTTARDAAVRVETICTHGDTPGAQALTRALRAGLEQAGVAVAAVAGPPPVSGCMGWWREGTPEGRRAVIAAGPRMDARRVRRHAVRAGAARDAHGPWTLDRRRRRAWIRRAAGGRGRWRRLRLDSRIDSAARAR